LEWFSIECRLSQPITTNAKYPMNQPELEPKTCNLRQARGNATNTRFWFYFWESGASFLTSHKAKSSKTKANGNYYRHSTENHSIALFQLVRQSFKSGNALKLALLQWFQWKADTVETNDLKPWKFEIFAASNVQFQGYRSPVRPCLRHVFVLLKPPFTLLQRFHERLHIKCKLLATRCYFAATWLQCCYDSRVLVMLPKNTTKVPCGSTKAALCRGCLRIAFIRTFFLSELLSELLCNHTESRVRTTYKPEFFQAVFSQLQKLRL